MEGGGGGDKDIKLSLFLYLSTALLCEPFCPDIKFRAGKFYCNSGQMLTLIKMGFLKNDLENFNCLFLKKVWSDDFFKNPYSNFRLFSFF